MTTQYIYIDEWQIDPKKREAKHPSRGTFILKSKSLQVLIMLVQANGEVVLKADIFKTVWPGTVVTENSLTQVISELRKVLGDTRHDSKYIQTFPNRGYSLTVDTSDISPPIHQKWIREQWKLILLTIMSLSLALGYWFYINDDKKTSYPSPNGQFTATISNEKSGVSLGIFAADNSDIRDVFFRYLVISSVETFSWSPDSKYFIVALVDSPESHHFIISPAGDLSKFYIEVSKDLNVHLRLLSVESTNTDLPFRLVNHQVISRYLHQWQLSNGQTIQIQFDQSGPTKISWH